MNDREFIVKFLEIKFFSKIIFFFLLSGVSFFKDKTNKLIEISMVSNFFANKYIFM